MVPGESRVSVLALYCITLPSTLHTTDQLATTAGYNQTFSNSDEILQETENICSLRKFRYIYRGSPPLDHSKLAQRLVPNPLDSYHQMNLARQMV